MESKDLHPNLLNLYSAYFGALPERVETITGSGSNRQYVRFFSTDGTSLIGVHGTSYEENHAFITLARHFFEKGLPVPQVLAVSDDEMCYLQNDLYRRLHQWIATDDGQCHTFNHIRRILHATIDSLLSALSDAVHIMVLKPVDIR